jgi:hypothetical protein
MEEYGEHGEHGEHGEDEEMRGKGKMKMRCPKPLSTSPSFLSSTLSFILLSSPWSPW